MLNELKIEELNGFTFTQIVASDSRTRKQLFCEVSPVRGTIFYDIFKGKELVHSALTLEEAIYKYNSI